MNSWRGCLIFLLLVTPSPAAAFGYVLAPDDSYAITLTDVATNVSDIPTLFTEANATVFLHGIQWQFYNESAEGAQLVYRTLLDDDLVITGVYPLQDMVPPETLEAGWIVVEKPGQFNISVILQVQYTSDPSIQTPTVAASRLYQVYFPFLTLLPILVIMGLAYLTGNVEISISTTNLVSVVITHGHFFRGMQYLVYGSILGALTDTYNGVIMLLVFFLSGIISLVEVTGGSKGLVRFVAKFVRQTRVVQILAYMCGVAYFWDDTTSILLVGHLFRPLLDVAHTSRPLQALILDASAGPITGVVILSTWLTWEIPLLQQELARIDNAQDIPALNMTPFEILKESLRYAFYPVFMLLLLPLLLWSQRHMGQVLLYERIAQVYQSKHGGPATHHGPCQPNLPVSPNTPSRWWNAFNPMALIGLLFIVFWFQTGISRTDPGYVSLPGEHWIVTTFAYSNMSLAWLQAISMGAAFYVVSLLLQWQEGDSVLFLPCIIPKIIAHNKAQKSKGKRHHEEDGLVHSQRENVENELRPLIPMMDLIGSFFFGFSRVMPHVIQFMLAWALRQSWVEMGLDRWMASMFGETLDAWGPEMIPTAAFITAFFMSMATGGANQGQVASILLPMAVKPIYASTCVSHPSMIYQVIGAIFSGCIAGDQAAPLSNTTLLSCLASDCHVIVHIITQLPYIAILLVLSLVFGTGPVGFGFYPVGAGYFLGVVFLLFFVFFLCFPILDPSGQWDLATRLYIRWFVKKNKKANDESGEDDGEEAHEDEEEEGNFWEILQRDTIRAATAMQQGVPYNTEDCRRLMQPIDSGITKAHTSDNMHRTSSSCGSSILEHGNDLPPTSAYSAEEEDSENPATGRPVRIIATDGCGTTNDTMVGSSVATQS